MKAIHKKTIVHLRPAEDFRAKDAVEEGALDEVGVILYVITVAKLDILREIFRTPLPPPVSIVGSSTM